MSFNPISLVSMGVSLYTGGAVNPQMIKELLGAAEKLAGGAQDLVDGLARMGLENSDNCDGNYGNRGGRGGAKSWLQAIAQMLGKIADQKAQELQQAADAISGGGNDPSALTNFQVKAQEFSMLMNTIVGALKSMGEGISAAAQASTR